MEATGISHIAFCVSDIEKSLEFYRDILGMTVIFDQVQDTTSGDCPASTNTPARPADGPSDHRRGEQRAPPG